MKKAIPRVSFFIFFLFVEKKSWLNKNSDSDQAEPMNMSDPDAVANNQEKKDKPAFLQELLAICVGVISPRSLNGLNHMNLDNDYHLANQPQNISMLFVNRL